MVVEKTDRPLWYKEPYGAKFIVAESNELAGILPKLYGYHLVFCGDPELEDLVESSLISHRIILSPRACKATTTRSRLEGDLESIPLRTETVDVVVLAHALENAQNPHEVLREAHRVLIPEGHLVITGFNPWSLWGIWHFYKQSIGALPSQGKLLSSGRIRDWLSLLNFQIVGGKMFYFRPPIGQEKLFQKCGFMEKWGQNAWPFWGGAYTLVAVKRVVPLTPIRLKWRPVKRIWQGATAGLPKPTTRSLKNSQK